MRAAFSDSLSSVVGQNASDPILLVSLLTGAPSLSAVDGEVSYSLWNSARCDLAWRLTPTPNCIEALLASFANLVPVRHDLIEIDRSTAVQALGRSVAGPNGAQHGDVA